MTVKTKFNIGDKVFTIDTNTLKVKEFVIMRMFINIHKEKNMVFLYDDDTYNGTSYDETKCFPSEKELMDFIKPEKDAKAL